MSLFWYILIVLIAIVVASGVIYLLDIFFIKTVFKFIVGKVRGRLDADKLKTEVNKIMETHRQKWAFKTYLGAVITLVGAGGMWPLIKVKFFLADDSRELNLEFLFDNGIPPLVLVAGIVFFSIAYFLYLYFSNKKYRNDLLSSSASIINEQFSFVPTQTWFRDKSELNIKNLGRSFDLSINFKYELFEDAFASTCRDERLAQLFTAAGPTAIAQVRESRLHISLEKRCRFH